MPIELTPLQPPYYEIVSGPAPAGTKYYTALLNQTATNAPVATILLNTLTGTPLWSYDAAGAYKLTLAGAFVNHKTVIQLQNSTGNQTIIVAYTGTPDNEIILETYVTGILSDGQLSDTPIQITVFP